MKKRILSLLLCCVMALGLLPMTAFAEDAFVGVSTADELIAAFAGDATHIRLYAISELVRQSNTATRKSPLT